MGAVCWRDGGEQAFGGFCRRRGMRRECGNGPVEGGVVLEGFWWVVWWLMSLLVVRRCFGVRREVWRVKLSSLGGRALGTEGGAVQAGDGDLL